jgi:hypothetical protein
LGLQWCDGRVLLEAAIDPQGRSLKPDQIRTWLAERLRQSLVLHGVRRDALLLRPC